MKLWISGALGHMGRAVAEKAVERGVEIIGGVDARGGAADFPLYASFADAPVMGDAIIDFSTPEALDGLLRYAVNNHVPAVLATTGYTPAQLAQIDAAARQVALFRSANMSLGVAVLKALARKAAEALGEGYDVEIIEAHHRRKVDAPSGTALLLYDAVKDAYSAPRRAVEGRSGRNCKRQENEIGIHAVRGGTVTGEHEVCFFGPSERIRLCHSAEDRGVFAAGALRAAAFLVGKAPGLYSMDDLTA